MANDIKTNRRAELVLIRSAEAAPYLTVGSKNYCKDQLVGKRNGQSYEFVIRDAGEYVEGMDISNVGSEDVIERKVTKNIKIGNVKVNTNLLEKVTDLTGWDKEIAEPYGEKVAKGLVQSVLADDIGLQNTAFVGTGWLPLFKASNYLESISSESQYAFVDPMVESIMQSSGRGFTPAGDVEPRFQKGLKGMVGQAEVRAQQGMPTLEISDELAAELASATVTSYATGTDYDTLTLNGVTESIPAGTPLFIAGVYATDMVGVKTSALKAFIAIEDATAGSVKVRKTDFVGNGTREACDIDGDNIVLSDLASKKLANPIKAGIYFTGIFRVNGAMEFDALPELDWSNAESRVTSPDGITLHEGRAVDVFAGTNKTRWAIAAVAGIVEPRGCAYVCIKDNTANLIAQ